MVGLHKLLKPVKRNRRSHRGETTQTIPLRLPHTTRLDIRQTNNPQFPVTLSSHLPSHTRHLRHVVPHVFFQALTLTKWHRPTLARNPHLTHNNSHHRSRDKTGTHHSPLLHHRQLPDCPPPGFAWRNTVAFSLPSSPKASTSVTSGNNSCTAGTWKYPLR